MPPPPRTVSLIIELTRESSDEAYSADYLARIP